jgi:hypothetical protein
MSQPETDDLQRRRRIVYVSPRRILECLKAPRAVFIRATNLPEGYEVHHCFYEPTRDSFGFFITHPSFDVVPVGCQSPEHEAQWFAELIQPQTNENALTNLD